MEGLLEAELFGGGVAYVEFHFELGADGDAEGETESVHLWEREDEIHRAILAHAGGMERPLADAGVAVHGAGQAAAARSEPREDQRHAAADGFAGREQAARTGEEHRAPP